MDERPTWPRPEDDDTSTQEPTEGIRIIGAEEAAEAIERGDHRTRRIAGHMEPAFVEVSVKVDNSRHLRSDLKPEEARGVLMKNRFPRLR